jgi:putative hydrolase of the HAD superfamily
LRKYRCNAPPPFMKYRHLFFDLDHTLWDFEANSKETLYEVYHAHQLHETLTPDFDYFFDRYSFHNKRLAKQMSLEYLQILPLKTKLFPYTIEIIEYLSKKGYALHLITNGFEDVQWGKLRNSQIDHYFGEVITSERAMALKPHKEIFEFALQQTGAGKAESIMIGDNLDADIRGAMEAGLDTVFVNHIGETTDLKPTYIVHHLKELESIF